MASMQELLVVIAGEYAAVQLVTKVICKNIQMDGACHISLEEFQTCYATLPNVVASKKNSRRVA